MTITTPSGLPPVMPADATTEIRPGEIVEARVVAVAEDGELTLATRLGLLSTRLPVALPVGSRAVFAVQSAKAGLTLALMEAIAAEPGASVEPAVQAGLAAKVEASGRVAPPAPQPGHGDQALADAVRQAAAAQAPVGDLVAELRRPAIAAALPASVRQSAAALLALVPKAEALVEPATLRAALAANAAFRPAAAAPSQPDAAPASSSVDQKSALLALRDALRAWSPLPAPPKPGLIGPAVLHPAADAPPAPAAPDPNRQPVADRLANLVLSSNDEVTPSPEDPQRAPRLSPTADAGPGLSETAMVPVPKDGSALLRILLSRLLAPMLQAEAQPKAAPASERPAPALPRADAPPASIAPSIPRIAEALPAPELRQALLLRTDAALDRLTLSHAANLPQEPPPGGRQVERVGEGSLLAGTAPSGHSWVMDLPVAWGRETATLALRILRERAARQAVGANGTAWTVEFALDTGATGPVHARLRLGGPALAVTLWAERSDTFTALRASADALRQSLDQATLAVGEIAILPGAPWRPAPAPGHLVDARS